ncbi:MAG: hypothetical protein ACREOU_06200, partial [Candidatus Eiseniibacteriota bacterium]
IMLLQPTQRERAPVPETGTVAPGIPTPAPSPAIMPAPETHPRSAGRVPVPLYGPFALEAPLRSGGGETNRIAVPRSATAVALLPPPLEGWPREAQLKALVLAPNGDVLFTREITNAELFPGAGQQPLVLRAKGVGFPEGRYTVRLSTLEPSALTHEPETAEYTFELSFQRRSP